MSGKKKKNSTLKKILLNKVVIKYVFIALAVVIVAVSGAIGVKKYILSETKTTKIGFEDIGEFATQSVYSTEVNVTDSARELWGMKIPFTQSKYIYSYDFVIKAGFDFGQIDWKVKNNKITVELPEVKILSNEVVRDSLKVFHEEESIFTPITLEENNEAVENMKKQAEEDAIANGLYDNARDNAEVMLTGFFGSVYDMDTYEIEFIYK